MSCKLIFEENFMEENNNNEAPEAPKKDLLKDFLCKFTIDGEVLVEKRGEEYYQYPLKDVELLPLPPTMKEAHISEMKLFHSLVLTIKKNHPRREVPVTRNEILRSGADKKILNDLVKSGYLKETIVPLVVTSGKVQKNPGSRVCFYYTPQGRALIRAKLDPNYAKTGYQ